MRYQIVAVAVILCCLTYGTADVNVDVVLDQLKQLVRDHVSDADKAQEYIAKIDNTRECLTTAKDINTEIIEKFAGGIIPAVTECGAKHMSIADPAERKENMKACFREKADNFKASSGMTTEEIEMFDQTRECIQEKAGE